MYTDFNLFYLHDAMLARVIVIATCLSVRLSVRTSVTRRYCVKTKKQETKKRHDFFTIW